MKSHGSPTQFLLSLSLSTESTDQSPVASAPVQPVQYDAVHVAAGAMIVVLPFLVVGVAMAHKHYRVIQRRRHVNTLERLWLLDPSSRRDKR